MGDNKEEQQHLLEHEPEDITYSRQSRPWKTKAFVLAVASFTVVVLTIALSIYASKPAASSPSKQASSQTVPQVQAVVALSDKYAGYKVLSVNVKDGQGKLVKDTANQLGLDHWNVGEGKVSFAVPAASLGKTEEWLQNADLTWWTEIDDVQKVIDQEKIAIAGKSKLTSQSEKAFTFQYDNYNTYAQMVAELKHVASDCPDGFTCEVFSIGQTYEKNNLTILHISKRHASNKAIWIDSLIHCREWITGATLMNIIRRLIYNYGTEESVTKLMDGFDWYFLPVMNPDGYIYTWTTVISWQVNLEIVYMLVNEASVNSQAPSDICLFSHLRPDRETKSRPKSGGDRMWRQNREPNRGSECVGTDLNRNYQYMWGGVGASTDPCNNEYRGDHPASAQETQHMQKIIDEMSDDILAWVSLHSCAQMWLTPWAYTEPENPDKCDYPPDYADLFVVADKATKALDKTNGKNFTAGNWCQEMYASSGVLQDHVKAVGKVKYAYTLELRFGEMCFIVDPSEIISSANEVYNGIIAMVDAIDELRNGDLKPC